MYCRLDFLLEPAAESLVPQEVTDSASQAGCTLWQPPIKHTFDCNFEVLWASSRQAPKHVDTGPAALSIIVAVLPIQQS